MTIRRELIEMLQERPMTIRELALHFRVMTDDIASDLRHIAKSIRPEMELRMEIPVCRSCGYEFRERTKLRTPSKCPECRHEKITEPKFWIQDS